MHLDEMTRGEVEKRLQIQLAELVKRPLVGNSPFFAGFVRAFEALELLIPHDAHVWVVKGRDAIGRALAEKGTRG